MNNKSILVLILISVLLSSCVNPQTLPTEPFPTTAAATTILSTDIPATATNNAIPNILTYTDHTVGFSIDYPANWFFESSSLIDANESQAYAVSITSWDILNTTSTIPKNNTVSGDKTKIDIAVVKQSITLEEAFSQQKQQITNNDSILFEQPVTLEGGLQGILWEVEGFAGPVRTLIIALNENMIYVSGYGNLQDFDAIALTFRAQ